MVHESFYILGLEELTNEVSHMGWFRKAMKEEEAHHLNENLVSMLTLFDRLGNDGHHNKFD